MRRSTVVQLTLLPMLATAAVAAAQPGPDQSPDAATSASAPAEDQAPGDIVIEPPGMTPTIIELDCEDDPNWRMRSDCLDYGDDGVVVVRGGFGGYFWSSHG